MAEKLTLLCRYIAYLRPYRWSILILFLLSVIGVGAQIPLPLIYSWMVDIALPSKNIHLLFALLGILLLSILFGTALSFVMQVVGARMRKNLIIDMRSSLYGKVQQMPYSTFAKFLSGDITARLTKDLDALRGILPLGFASLLRDGLVVIGLAIVLLVMDWRLAILSAAMIPFFFLLFFGVYGTLWRLSRHTHNTRGNMQAVLQEKVEGARDIHLTNSFDYQESHARKIIGESEGALADLNIEEAKLEAGMVVFPVIGSIILWGIGGWGVIHGSLTLGQIIAFSYAFTFMFGPLSRLFVFVGSIQYELAALERIFGIVPEEAGKQGIMNGVENEKVGDIHGKVELKDIRFSYANGNEILHNVNLKFEPGEAAAILGSSGSGKTTLLSLIARLYVPLAGRIEIGDQDVRAIAIPDLRRIVGFVPQDVFIFRGTLRENILLGRTADLEKFNRACELSGVTELAKRFPNDLNTLISEKGGNLSGGERQRIAIARALLEDPKILLLDEPSNNLDGEAMQRIRQGILIAQEGKTIILVTHNAGLLDGIENVYELRDGNIHARVAR